MADAVNQPLAGDGHDPEYARNDLDRLTQLAPIRLDGAARRPGSGHATGMGYFQLRLLKRLLT